MRAHPARNPSFRTRNHNQRTLCPSKSDSPAPKNYELKLDRIAYWKGVGAIVSPVVQSLLKRQKRTEEGKPEHTHQKISKGKKAKLAKAAKAAAN